MRVNAEFDRRVIEHAAEMEWAASPMAGVSRRMLDRIGDEVARATSIVRYDAGSLFSPHVHNGGEEFLVLEGVFQDEHGDFPVGTYVRNPINTSHMPASELGCEIFVKLWQFGPAETEIVRIDTNAVDLVPVRGRPGVYAAVLYEDDRETVTVECWDSGADVPLAHEGGVELLVLEGDLEADGELLRRHSWLRLPKDEHLAAKAGAKGVRLWVKTGHLRHVQVPPIAEA
jgi:anti-sigma factor ChrR (cupin superfamily)